MNTSNNLKTRSKDSIIRDQYSEYNHPNQNLLLVLLKLIQHSLHKNRNNSKKNIRDPLTHKDLTRQMSL